MLDNNSTNEWLVHPWQFLMVISTFMVMLPNHSNMKTFLFWLPWPLKKRSLDLNLFVLSSGPFGNIHRERWESSRRLGPKINWLRTKNPPELMKIIDYREMIDPFCYRVGWLTSNGWNIFYMVPPVVMKMSYLARTWGANQT